MIKKKDEKRKPWEHYNSIKQATISTAELIESLKVLYPFNHHVGACVIIIFLTNSRICEVLRYKYLWVKNEQLDPITKRVIPMSSKVRKEKLNKGEFIEIFRNPISWRDIKTKIDDDGKKWLYITTRVEKGKNPNKEVIKEAIIPLDESYYLYPLIVMLENYLQEIGWFDSDKGYLNLESEGIEVNTSDTPLFTFSDEFVRKKLVDKLGIPPHVLRHIRSKFLVEREGFSVQDLMEYTGWRSPEIPILYSKSNKEVLKMRYNKMMERDKERKEKYLK